jgi:type-F conjugative transfer system secretin TraK
MNLKFNNLLKTPALALLTMSFLTTAVANAAIVRTLDESKSIEISISKQNLTRITVKDDRVANVFGITGEYVLEADEELGQVFIRPIALGGSPFMVGGGTSKPIHLTLTTEKGHTQDLRLTPKDQAPEALILEENKQETFLSQGSMTRMSAAQVSATRVSIARDEIEGLLQACQEMRIPLRYKVAPLDLKTFKGPHLLIREIRGEKLRALTYEVKNLSTLPLILSEDTFTQIPHAKKSDIIAVWIAKKTINPGESTYVHVIAKL